MFKFAHSTSRVSKDGSLSSPYASRPHRAKLSSDYPEVQHRNMKYRQEYYSLTDPHLTHYYRRKLLLSLEGSPKPRVTSSSLSFRSQSSFSGRASVATTSHTPSGHTPAPQSTYKVVLKTGSAANAGTSARVHISLQGSKGTLKRRRLQKRGVNSSPFSFAPGSSETFRIRGKDVGDISHVTIESGGLKKEEAWYVESVTVSNEAGVKWACSFRQWLSLYHSDCQLSRTAKAKLVHREDQQSVDERPITYVAEVLTGDVRGGGTEANVFLTLHGSKLSSSKQQLHGDYTRGSTVRSDVNCPASLGPVEMVTVAHDNSGFGADWFLDQVTLYPTDRPQDKVYFSCGQWLSRTQGDGLIERTIAGSTEPPKRLTPQLTYVVTTVTGAMRGAGTSANVFVTLYGENGVSQEKRLDNHPDNFDRGRTDSFLLSCPDLGPIDKVRIRHDNSGIGASWYLEEVTIKVSKGRDKLTNKEGVVRFPCGRWLERCEGCGGEVEVDLYPSAGGQSSAGKRESHRVYEYRVTTVTGAESGAGTSANAFIVLCARDGGHSLELRLDNGRSSLRAGQEDTFTVACEGGRHFSPLEAVVVRHDDTGVSPGWRLEEVQVECLSTGQSWQFPCHQWLSKDRGDRRIRRELHPLQPDVTPISSTWDIRIITSDLRGAGTDANVTLQLHGNRGSSAAIPLGDNVANFEQGEEDVFMGVEVRGCDLGELEGVTLSHDGTGPYPDWHVQSVHLVNTASGREYQCHCDSWLSEENGNSVRLAAVENTLQSTSPPNLATPKSERLKNLTIVEQDQATPWRGPQLSMPSSATTSTPTAAVVNCPHEDNDGPLLDGMEISRINEQDSSITNKYLQHLRNNQTMPTFNSHTELDSTYQSPPTRSEDTMKTIPYTIHVLAGPHPTGSHTPYLQLVLCSHRNQSLPIPLEPVGPRPPTGSPETYSVEALEMGPLHAIKLQLVGGASGSRWLVNKVTVHSPTTGRTHHFQCGRVLVCGGGESVFEVMDVLTSSVNTSTVLSTPRGANTPLTAYEVKVMTSDKKHAGTSHSLYIVMLTQDGSSKTFHFKNSSRNPKFQRGQTDTFQVATPSLGPPVSLKVAHCPRKKAKEDSDKSSWYLFQIVLSCLASRTKYYFTCRKWVDGSLSSENLKFTEIALSKTEHL